jgi:hypothetical protein
MEAEEVMSTGRLEVQGIVSVETNEPLVQFRQVEDDKVVAEWQAGVSDAREMAQQIVEAAMNATYDAALVSFINETWPHDKMRMASVLLPAVRKHRADTWGLPDQPEDWRPK